MIRTRHWVVIDWILSPWRLWDLAALTICRCWLFHTGSYYEQHTHSPTSALSDHNRNNKSMCRLTVTAQYEVSADTFSTAIPLGRKHMKLHRDPSYSMVIPCSTTRRIPWKIFNGNSMELFPWNVFHRIPLIIKLGPLKCKIAVCIRKRKCR